MVAVSKLKYTNDLDVSFAKTFIKTGLIKLPLKEFFLSDFVVKGHYYIKVFSI